MEMLLRVTHAAGARFFCAFQRFMWANQCLLLLKWRKGTTSWSRYEWYIVSRHDQSFCVFSSPHIVVWVDP